MRYLGVDYGAKRVGLAFSDEDGRMAFPHSVVLNNGLGNLVSKIRKICEKENIKTIIVGQSLNYKKEANAIMTEIEKLKALLELHDLQVLYENETLTSSEAERLQGKNNKLDASAAAVILGRFLEKECR